MDNIHKIIIDKEIKVSVKGKDYSFKIIQDQTPNSPREDSNLGVILSQHKRYNFSDGGNKFGWDTWEEMEKHIKEELGGIVITPLYLIDHSSLTLSISPFSVKWDSGQVGFIYTTKELCEEIGFNPDDHKKIKEIFEGELNTYNSYLNGEIYGFNLDEVCTCDKCHNAHNNNVESVWGFYNTDYKEMLKSMLEHVPDAIVKEIMKTEGI